MYDRYTLVAKFSVCVRADKTTIETSLAPTPPSCLLYSRMPLCNASNNAKNRSPLKLALTSRTPTTDMRMVRWMLSLSSQRCYGVRPAGMVIFAMASSASVYPCSVFKKSCASTGGGPFGVVANRYVARWTSNAWWAAKASPRLTTCTSH